MVRAPTPDAMLRGVEVTAEVLGADLLVVDVGGATTDVYSVVTPEGEDATLRKDVVGTLWNARTVEGDLGVRWNAVGVVEAAARERIPVGVALHRYAATVVRRPRAPAGRRPRESRSTSSWPPSRRWWRSVRHGRPGAPGASPRPLGDVGLVLGSGGVLRHATARAGYAGARRRHRRPRRRLAGAEVGADRRRRAHTCSSPWASWPTTVRSSPGSSRDE